MPFNRPYRRRNRQPAYRRKYRKLAPRRKMAYRKKYDNRLTKNIQPNIAYVQMKYSTSFSLNPGLGGSATHHFRANSIYDPDFDAVGHQPSLHDLYEGLYQHYEVLGSTIYIRPMPVPELAAGESPQNNSGARLSQVAITTIQVSSEPTLDIETIRELKRGPVMFVNDNTMVNSRSNVIKKSWNKRNWYGRESPQETAAGFGNNPNSVAYFRVQQSSVASTIDPITLNYICDIYYKVKLTRPITQAKS